MKYIKKLASPEALEEYKKREGASYKKLPSSIKKQLKIQLIQEQGGICCYCCGRIRYEDSNIEHFLPKDDLLFPELQLEYSNLLSSCLGGQIDRQTNRRFPLSCDAKKNNRVVPISPTDPNCEEQFDYDDDGSIYGLTENARSAIQILNLNNQVIKNRRKAAIKAYVDFEFSPEEWENEASSVLQRDREGLFKPFCFAAAYWIRANKL